jgi:hypothetical protein
MCRKHHGSLYATVLGVDRAHFQWLSGEADIVHYRSSAAFERPFCKHCGSTVPDTSAEVVFVPAGTLLDDPGMKPSAHIFVASKSPMWDINDALPKFDAYPPGFGTAVEFSPSSSNIDALTGSCLCGEIAYTLDAPPTNVVNCHCTRCQRSRGAAHATNAFVRQEHLRWLRGAELLKTYRVPDAQAFSTSFCSKCGSVLPSLFAAIKRYNIPLGTLDRPLATKPSLHIYAVSRALWHTISDSLQQFDEMPPRDRVKELMF